MSDKMLVSCYNSSTSDFFLYINFLFLSYAKYELWAKLTTHFSAETCCWSILVVFVCSHFYNYIFGIHFFWWYIVMVIKFRWEMACKNRAGKIAERCRLVFIIKKKHIFSWILAVITSHIPSVIQYSFLFFL